MRVLTFTTLYPNRIQPTNCIFVHQRMRHFALAPGNEVTVVAPVPYFPPWWRASSRHSMSQVPRQEQIDGLTVYHPRYPLLPGVSMPLHGWFLFLGSLALVKRLHRTHRFDLIDAHYVYPDGFAAVLLGRLLGLPVIVSARGTDMNLFPSFRLIRPMIRWTLRRAAAGIGVCTPLKDAMVQFGLPPDRAQVIGNGVDLERFSPVDQASARQRLQLPRQAQIVVAVGGLIERKGYHFLIPALDAIRGRHPSAQLYIVGEGPWRDRLQSLTRNHGLEDRVFFRGVQPNEELKYWYSAADVSCLASSREGWPNVILESMACGTPVVATRVWGVPEVIVSPELGLMVEQNVPSIAAGLANALGREWNRALVRRYAEKRTWTTVAAEVESVFQAYVNRTVNKPELQGSATKSV